MEVMLPDGDRDGDGLPDNWETVFFGGPTNAVGAADDDSDGQSNYAEYIAGTSPVDPASVFRLTSVQASPGGSNAVLAWSSVANRAYDVQWTTNLTAGPWQLGPTTYFGNAAHECNLRPHCEQVIFLSRRRHPPEH
ncbi:MAG: hypothetical protein V9H26_10595 [Verrucomicrobiota bacterium]